MPVPPLKMIKRASRILPKRLRLLRFILDNAMAHDPMAGGLSQGADYLPADIRFRVRVSLTVTIARGILPWLAALWRCSSEPISRHPPVH